MLVSLSQIAFFVWWKRVFPPPKAAPLTFSSFLRHCFSLSLIHVHTCGDTLVSEIYYYRDIENYTSIIYRYIDIVAHHYTTTSVVHIYAYNHMVEVGGAIYMTCPWTLQGCASLYTKNQTSMNLYLGAMSL